jgi:hypothetical protein
MITPTSAWVSKELAPTHEPVQPGDGVEGGGGAVPVPSPELPLPLHAPSASATNAAPQRKLRSIEDLPMARAGATFPGAARDWLFVAIIPHAIDAETRRDGLNTRFNAREAHGRTRSRQSRVSARA